jgi:dipeptidase, putative
MVDRKTAIDKKISENFAEEIKFLQEIVAINSVGTGPEGDMPFGRGVQEVYEHVLEKGRSFGFDTEDIDRQGGHIEFGGIIRNEAGEITGTSDETVGIVAHLDTVPLGDGWTHDPLGGERDGGRIYGRGTSDDKGPAAAAMFAMKALADLDMIPEKRIRLILGLNEETGWSGMHYYNERVKEPDLGWTPDAYFPAIRGEMGTLMFDIAKKFAQSSGDGLELRTVKGGSAPNMVPDFARAVVRSKDAGDYEAIREKIAEKRRDGVTKISAKSIGSNLEISVEGEAAHGSKPQDGVNAITALMAFLGEFEFANDDAADVIDFYNTYIGNEFDGASLGCRLEDDDSGATILNAGMIAMNAKELKLTVNIRYPITFTDEDIYSGMMPVLGKYNMGVVKNMHMAPICFAEDSELISTLMDVYAEETGDTESRALVIGGGTYARAFSNVVAFGGLFPGEEETFHCAEEYIAEESLLKMTRIFAQAIDRLGRSD